MRKAKPTPAPSAQQGSGNVTVTLSKNQLAALQSMERPYCRSCGTRNDAEARFCDSCGTSMA